MQFPHLVFLFQCILKLVMMTQLPLPSLSLMWIHQDHSKSKSPNSHVTLKWDHQKVVYNIIWVLMDPFKPSTSPMMMSIWQINNTIFASEKKWVTKICSQLRHCIYFLPLPKVILSCRKIQTRTNKVQRTVQSYQIILWTWNLSNIYAAICKFWL